MSDNEKMLPFKEVHGAMYMDSETLDSFDFVYPKFSDKACQMRRPNGLGWLWFIEKPDWTPDPDQGD